MNFFEIFLLIIGTVLAVISAAYIVFCCQIFRMNLEIAKKIKGYNAAIKTRYELVAALIGLLEQYSTHPIMERIIETRHRAMNSLGKSQALKNNQELTLALNDLKHLVEEIGELKDNEQLMVMRAKISAKANKIYSFKQSINDIILVYNYKFQAIYFRYFAKMIKFQKNQYFVILPEEKIQ